MNQIQQENIPVGCVPTAAVACFRVGGGWGVYPAGYPTPLDTLHPGYPIPRRPPPMPYLLPDALPLDTFQRIPYPPSLANWNGVWNPTYDPRSFGVLGSKKCNLSHRDLVKCFGSRDSVVLSLSKMYHFSFPTRVFFIENIPGP